MNALAPIHIPTEATWEETRKGYWTVTLGHESRAISQESPSCFIAWIGHQSKHWCFARALKACVDDIEFRKFEAAEAQRAHDEAIASLMRMTPAQRDRAIARLTEERDLLEYAGAEVDLVARRARLDRQISRLRGI
jgi:hypothetical protein